MNYSDYNIFIIEDNRQVVKMLTLFLTEKGFKVRSALTGEEGLREIKNHRPDLVILDIGLPGIDGFEVCERIKTDVTLKDIPVVMLTGRDQGNDFDWAMEKRADWYVVKPYEIEHLLKVFNRLLPDK